MKSRTARGRWKWAMLATAGAGAWILGGCSVVTGLSDFEKCGDRLCLSRLDASHDTSAPAPDGSVMVPDVSEDTEPPHDTDEPSLPPLDVADVPAEPADQGVRPDLGRDVTLRDLPELADADLEDGDDGASDVYDFCSTKAGRVIDDMLGMSPKAKAQCGRGGSWTTGVSFARGATLNPRDPAMLFDNCDMQRCLHISGTLPPSGGQAGVGLPFRADGKAYDVSAWRGIEFDIRTAAPEIGGIKVRAALTQTAGPINMCLTTECSVPNIEVQITREWQTIGLSFDFLRAAAENDASAPLDLEAVTGLLFTTNEASYDIQLRNIRLYFTPGQ